MVTDENDHSSMLYGVEAALNASPDGKSLGVSPTHGVELKSVPRSCTDTGCIRSGFLAK